jgi:hypothetical protein
MGVREMITADLNQIIALEKAHQLHPWPKEAFEQALRIGHYCCVYEEGHPHDPEAVKITAYGVANKGHGRTICATGVEGADAIYKAWFDYGTAQGIKEYYAEIEPENRAARIRLKHFGFRLGGVRAHFYGIDKPAHAWVRHASEPNQTDTQQNEAVQGSTPTAESA